MSTPQRKGRRALLNYIARLGKRKAARRLDATVAEVDRYLERGHIPALLLPEVLGLDILGGGYTHLRGTSLREALKEHGARKLAALTGLSGARLRQLVKRRPRGPIKVKRERVAKIGKRVGWAALADTLDATKSVVKVASEYPQTRTTKRLTDFVDEYGEREIAWFLGIDDRTLERWLRTNVPRAWESDLNAIIGRRSDEGITRDEIRGRLLDKRKIATLIDRATERARKWNKKVPARYRIRLSDAERWARLREFPTRFERAKKAYEEYKKERKKPSRPRPGPPPIGAPPPRPRPIFPEEPAPLPKAPRKTAPPIEKATAMALTDFRAKRAAAIAEGRDQGYRMVGSPGRYTLWEGSTRNGWRFFGKVQEFVLLLNLTALGNKIIENAETMWNFTGGPGEFMTIKIVLSAQGTGNPFYPGAFEPDKNEFSFFSRTTGALPEPHLIRRAVRLMLEEVYMVNEEHNLFFEFYEIVKSIPTPRKPD